MRNRFIIVTILIAGLLLLSCTRKSPDLIVACGWDEVFISDISKDVPEKIWTWRAEESEGLPSYMRNKFLTTDECKPVEKGSKILITSSGGGVALVMRESGNLLFYASVPNAHSAEMLPGGFIVAAASYSSEGNRLNIYSLDNPDVLISSDSLYGAHAVVWDKKREILWAMGTDELRSYSLIQTGSSIQLKPEESIMLPDREGHDLVFADNNKNLLLTTAEGVWNYNISEKKFTPHDVIGSEGKVKSLSYNSGNKRLAYVKATEETWWAYYIRFSGETNVVYLPGEKIYKVRWLNY